MIQISGRTRLRRAGERVVLIIGLIFLPMPIGPSETMASIKKDYLVLRLAKSVGLGLRSFVSAPEFDLVSGQ
jgi:hypothetical protein